MIKIIIIFLFCVLPLMMNAITITVGTGRGGPNVEEVLLRKMSDPDVRVTQDLGDVSQCKKIKVFNLEKYINDWKISSNFCLDLRLELKKKTYLLKGNTLLFKVGPLGCPKDVVAEGYWCA